MRAALIVALIVAAVGGLWYAHKSRLRNYDAAVAAAEPERRATLDTERARLESQRAEEDRLDQQRKQFDENLQDVARQQREKAEFDKAIERMDDVVRRWKDALDIATRTSRITVSGPVSKLQELHREAEGLIVPECLERAKQELLLGMSGTIDALLVFMQNALPDLSDMVARLRIKEASEHFASYSTEASACAPVVPEPAIRAAR